MATCRAALCLPFIFLVACGSDDSTNSAAAFQAACESSTNLSAELCACIAESAKEDLSSNGIAFLTAGLNQDEAATAALRDEMAADELVIAGMYMVSAPLKCAQKTQ